VIGAAGYDDPMEASTANDPTACIPVRESKRLPCDLCGHPMEPEHAHYRCPACHYILPCCGW
jgi:Zn finger protein HypA/HybF involved in hydrogenase expression